MNSWYRFERNLRTHRSTDISFYAYNPCTVKYCINLRGKFTFLRKFSYCSQYENTESINELENMTSPREGA